MSDITLALAVAKKNTARLTKVQVYHLTKAGLLGMNEEGEFIITEKAERKVARGKTKGLIEGWAPEVRRAVMTPEAHNSLDGDGRRKISFDSVWKFLGSPDKAVNRSPMLATIKAMAEEGTIVQVRPNPNNNFGIYYINPEWS